MTHNEEAARLAEASDNSGAQAQAGKQAKLLRVRVVEERPPSGQRQGPDRRGQVGHEDGPGLSPEMKDANLDWESIMAIVQEGEQGKDRGGRRPSRPQDR